MKSVLDVEVSCFASYSGKEPKTVNLLTWLRSAKYADKIQELRAIENKKRRDQIKATLPAITPSGIFYPTRKSSNLVKHSGLICLDIDLKGNEDITNYNQLKQQLFNIQHVAYAGLSASGKGFFLIIPIAYPKYHKEHFLALQRDFMKIGITIDAAPKNIASLRGYFYDSNAHFRHRPLLYNNIYHKRYNNYLGQGVQLRQPSNNQWSTKERVEWLVGQIVQQRIDITRNEPDWFRIGCALANEFGESGRRYFHQVSQFHPEYDSKITDKKFNKVLKAKYKNIGLGSFFKLVSDLLIE